MDLAEEVRALRENVETLAVLVSAEKKTLLTTAECASLLGVAEVTLYEWRKERKGPPFLHIGERIVRYVRDDVLAWAKTHQITCN